MRQHDIDEYPPDWPQIAQRCACICGCANVATTDDGNGIPMCQGCYNDYYGIAPEQEQAELEAELDDGIPF